MKARKLEFKPGINITYEKSRLSNNMGMILFFEFLNKINFSQMIDEYVHFVDDRKSAKHSYKDIFYQIIFQLIAGYPYDTSANNLRYDPVLLLAYEKDELASQSTLSRFMNNLSQDNVSEMYDVVKKLGRLLYAYNFENDLFIDLGLSDSYHLTNGFSDEGDLLIAFDSYTRGVIAHEQAFRPISDDGDLNNFTKEVLNFLNFNQNIIIRARKPFSNSGFYDVCNKHGVFYLVEHVPSPTMIEYSQKHIQAEKHPIDINRSANQYFTIDFKDEAWSSAYKVAVKVTRPAGELLFSKFEFIVNNLTGYTAREVFDLYYTSADYSEYFDELSDVYYYTRNDKSAFVIKEARLMLCSIAYNIIKLLQVSCLSDEAMSVNSLRLKLIRVAGRVVKHTNSTSVRLSKSYGHGDLFWKILERIQSL